MSEDNSKLWTELKIQWAKLKKESGATQQEKDAAKVRINGIQKALDKPVTDWNAPKEGFKPNDSPKAVYGHTKVNWPEGNINRTEINEYNTTVSNAFEIAKERHPELDVNSDKFGTIVSAICGHLLAKAKQ